MDIPPNVTLRTWILSQSYCLILIIGLGEHCQINVSPPNGLPTLILLDTSIDEIENKQISSPIEEVRLICYGCNHVSCWATKLSCFYTTATYPSKLPATIKQLQEAMGIVSLLLAFCNFIRGLLTAVLHSYALHGLSSRLP